jgi:serine/threonine protein kinase
MAGQSISHYRIAEKFAGGGMSVIYQAEDTRLRFVALTFLPEDVARNPQSLARFHCKAQAASALNHSNICIFYDSGEQDRRAFAENVWIAGRVSGHDFKHGPVMSELAAEAFLGVKTPPIEMGLRPRLKIGSS